MRIKRISLYILLAATASGANPQTAESKAGSATPDTTGIIGVWRAQADGLPFITLDITNEGGNLSGAVLFYLHRRDEGQPVTSTPGVPEPLLNLRFDGKTLTFQVSHRHAHPPRTLLDPPVSFRLRLTGANKSELINENEGSSSLALVRTEAY